MNNQHNPIIKRLINDLLTQYSKNIIAIYGIGSNFDDSLPSNWVKNDFDIIIIAKLLTEIPKQDWTDVRYKKLTINGYEVWFGFNTIEAYQDRYRFNKLKVKNYSVL